MQQPWFSWRFFARSPLMGRMFSNRGKLRWHPDSTSSQDLLDCSHPQECFFSWLIINMGTLSAEAKAKQQDLSRETLHRLWLPAPVRPVQRCHNKVILSFLLKRSQVDLQVREQPTQLSQDHLGGEVPCLQCNVHPQYDGEVRSANNAILTLFIFSQKKQVDIEDLDIETVKDMLK